MGFWASVTAVSFSLFLLMDPVGNVPLFVAILKDHHMQRQRMIIFREMCIALAVIITFTFLGEAFLDVLGISHSSTLISGGIILFLIAIRMIFPSHQEDEVTNSTKKEPLVFPLAIPLVAGPGVLAAVSFYSHNEPWQVMVVSIVIAWVVSTTILLCGSHLKKVLGPRGITACERLMGLLLTLMAVELFMHGLSIYIGK